MLTVNIVFLHNVGIQPHHPIERAQSTGFVMDGCHSMSGFSLFEDPDLGGDRLRKGEENTHGMFAS